jgi:hypothetical protein
MIANKKIIESICVRNQLKMTEELKSYIIQEFGTEPFPYIWSEQDLYENIRKLIIDYWNGSITIKLKTPNEKLRDDYNDLQDMYIEKLGEINSLESKIQDLEKTLNNIFELSKKFEDDIQF